MKVATSYCVSYHRGYQNVIKGKTLSFHKIIKKSHQTNSINIFLQLLERMSSYYIISTYVWHNRILCKLALTVLNQLVLVITCLARAISDKLPECIFENFEIARVK